MKARFGKTFRWAMLSLGLLVLVSGACAEAVTAPSTAKNEVGMIAGASGGIAELLNGGEAGGAQYLRSRTTPTGSRSSTDLKPLNGGMQASLGGFSGSYGATAFRNGDFSERSSFRPSMGLLIVAGLGVVILAFNNIRETTPPRR